MSALQRADFHANPSVRVTELIIDKHGNLRRHSVSWRELLDISARLESSLSSSYRNKVFGVVAEKGASMIGIVMGVIGSGNAFLLLEPGPKSYLARQVARFQLAGVIFAKKYSPQCHQSLDFFDSVECGGELCVAFLGNSFDSTSELLYAIQTSGSTGEPKMVLVPHSAIMPNIDDFIERFSISESSTVLYSTSLSFDPSMVELLLAIKSGCELVIPPKGWIGAMSETVLNEMRLSFVQLTPAVLQCLPSEVLARLLGPDSLVESLLVGGDQFPLNLIKNYYTRASKVRIFNVYGITEVSCWATCHEFALEDEEKYSSASCIPIGEPLLNTRLEISGDGILQIHGRKCLVNFEPSEGPTSTNDHAFSVKGFPSKEEIIFVKGRFKPNSILPTFETEEEVLRQFPEIVFSKLIYLGVCSFLFVDSVDGATTVPTSVICSKLPQKLWPIRIFWNIPRLDRLSSNGKIDECFLEQFVRSKYAKMTLVDFVKEHYAIGCFAEGNTSLRSLGIGSLEAAEIAFVLANGNPNVDPGVVMRFILDERNTVGQLLAQFDTKTLVPRSNSVSSQLEEQAVVLQSVDGFRVTECWGENLGKCIDGSPACQNGVVFASAHSGVVKGVDVPTGKITFEHREEGDRLEAGCSVSQRYLAFGGFSGRMSVFDSTSQPSTANQPILVVECQAEIRMIPAFDADENMFWGDYQGRVWMANILTRQTVKFDSFNFGPLRANCLLLENSLIFGTLNGFAFSFHKVSHTVVWFRQFDSPVFAAPTTFDRHFSVILTVKGSMNLLRCSDGEVKSSISLASDGASFFDSPAVIGDTAHLLVATGNSHSFLLIACTPDLELLRHICIPGAAPIVRRPQTLCDSVYFLDTKGSFYCASIAALFAQKDVQVERVFSLNNAETFGLPLLLPIQREYSTFTVILGARDDRLRCFVIERTSGRRLNAIRESARLNGKQCDDCLPHRFSSE